MSPSSAASRPGRFYREASAVRLADGRAGVLLDDRALKTPQGTVVVLPTLAAAERLAGEWRDHGAQVDLGRMPITRLAFTALDRGATARGEWIEEVARYAQSDLLCHFAEAPEGLVALQAARWTPWLAWARDVLGADLQPTCGVMPRAQSVEALARIRRAASGYDAFVLVALVAACGLFGSAVLAFAVTHKALSGEAAHSLARLDEAWQEARWGEDAEAAARTALRLEEARALEGWLEALQSG